MEQLSIWCIILLNIITLIDILSLIEIILVGQVYVHYFLVKCTQNILIMVVLEYLLVPLVLI